MARTGSGFRVLRSVLGSGVSVPSRTLNPEPLNPEPVRRRVNSIGRSLAVILMVAVGHAGAAIAGQTSSFKRAVQPDAQGNEAPFSVRITSPLGRTGVVSRVRIVAQLHVGAGTAAPLYVRFLVDGQLVGTADAGPSYSVDWTDANPFERREITAVAEDAAGLVARDSIVLPPFEVSDQTDVMSVLLETGVYDRTGRFLSNLSADAFDVRENGVQQTVDLVAHETLPTTLLLLVDNSQSMSRRMEFVRAAAQRIAGSLRENDQVIVTPFKTHIGASTGPTNDRATIAEAIDAMQAGGGTAILDALEEATDLLRGRDGRRVIILVTDGYDENSITTMESALKRAEESEVTIYGVGIGGVAGISFRGEEMLRAMAERTGGRVFLPPRETDLASVSEGVAADAHSRYLITYTPSNQKKDGAWRGIEVEAQGAYRVRTRPGYFAPAPVPIRPAVEFTVKDAAHDYVDVTADDVQVLEDGIAQTVDTFQEAVDPVSIVMALDESGSMKKSAEAVKQAAREFVAAVRPEDSLALITFADKPMFQHTLATNRDWTLDAIEKYAPSGGTALYDALYNSLLHLRGVPGRHAVIVLTDGRDENNPGTAPGSEHTFAEVVNLMRTVGAAIYPIGLGTKVDRGVLEPLARESGGEANFPSDASSLAVQYRHVVENLRRRYVLSYTSTNSDHDGEWRKVTIHPRTDGLVVASAGGYFAPER
jgi:Ca-activated chloride channel homolog